MEQNVIMGHAQPRPRLARTTRLSADTTYDSPTKLSKRHPCLDRPLRSIRVDVETDLEALQCVVHMGHGDRDGIDKVIDA